MMLSSIDSVVVFTIVSVPSTIKLPPTLKLLVTTVSPVAVIVHKPEDAMVKFVPSPSIFSPSSPNVIPMFAGTLMSPPVPTLIDKSVPSDSIFSAPPVSKTTQ